MLPASYGIVLSGEDTPPGRSGRPPLTGARSGHEIGTGAAVFRRRRRASSVHTLLCEVRRRCVDARLLLRQTRHPPGIPSDALHASSPHIARPNRPLRGARQLERRGRFRRLVVQCPSLVLLEWPKVFSRPNPSDSRPDVRFYDAGRRTRFRVISTKNPPLFLLYFTKARGEFYVV